MKKSLGNKRNEIGKNHIEEITNIYGDFKENKYCKIFDNEDFGYWQITVERPLIENGKVVKDKNGKPKSDSDLRDTENVPLKEDIKKYFEREVLPYNPDAWIDETKTRKGYEISFTKYFYEFKPLRTLEQIKKDILELEKQTEGMMKEIIK